VPVQWEVAEDAGFRRIVTRGEVVTGRLRDHTVKADARGLRAARTYWYRFRCAGVLSPVGRTRTAPAAGSPVRRMRMAVVSCANLQAGWFSAYRHLAARTDLDLVVHVGDYFYEYPPGQYQAVDVVVRPHDPPWELIRLADYRRRHAQYKADPDLQSLHAKVPWVLTWDDHESADNAWSGGALNHTPGPVEGDWQARRAASQQAYAEWMPVRYEAGGHLYRRLTFGRLASLSMLDLRTYRDQQASSPVDPVLADPKRTITGKEQEAFLLAQLDDDSVQWKLIGNPVMIAPLLMPAPGDVRPEHQSGVRTQLDQWDGYPVEQARVIAHLGDNGVTDAVFLTGDRHTAWGAELPADAATYASTGHSVGVELVCTSVTSDNLADLPRSPSDPAPQQVGESIQAANPHIKYVDLAGHGFSVLEVTPRAAQMDWFKLTDRTDPNSTAVWSTSWRVSAGSSRLQRAAGPLV
jgi:alkaline phosphatase D